MPFPKISPVLNNCPFYALTPELKDEIAKYAADGAHDNGHNAQYALLKQHFGAYYGIDPLSWKDFAGILKNYNAHDTQILLGPVLRNFSKEMMQKGDQEELMLMAIGNDIYDTEQYIKATTEINAHNGRYDSLAPDHLFKYAAGPLGLSVTYNKTGNPARTFDAAAPVAAVSIYHHGNIQGAQAGGHWERVQRVEDAVDYQSAEDTQLTPLLPLLGDNATLNTLGIDLLKKHVQLMHRHEKDNYDMTADVQEMMLTSAQTQQYMWNINYLPKPLAVKLLGDELTEGTKKLINDMVIGHIDREPIIQRYFEAPLGNKPHVAVDAREIITKLEQGVKVPKVFIPPVKKEALVESVDDLVDEVLVHPVELEVQEKEVSSPISVHHVEEVVDHGAEHNQGKGAVVDKTEEVQVEQVAPKKAKHKKDKGAKKSVVVDRPEVHDEVHVDSIVLQPEPKKDKAPKPKKKAVVENHGVHEEVHVDPIVLHSEPKKDKAPKPKKKAVIENPDAHKDSVEQVLGPIEQVSHNVHVDLAPDEVMEEEAVLPNLFGPVHYEDHEPIIDEDLVIESPKEIKPEPEKIVLPDIVNPIYKQAQFKKHIDALESQITNLRGRRDAAPVNSDDYQKLDEAYKKANGVHTTLKEAGRKYFAKEMSYADFKKCSDDTIKDAKPVLETHRGGKEILEVLLNIALFLGVLARSAWNGKMTFFKVDTESVKKVDALADSINKAAPGA